MNCESCGIPWGTYSVKGYNIPVVHRAENKFQRDSKRTVWCCSQRCAVIALAVSAMGPSSHDWPITLKEFTGRLDRQKLAEMAIDSKGVN